MKKERKVQEESGAVVILFLVLFFVMALFFFAMYQLVASDYTQSANAIEGKSDGLKQNNLVESILQNYSKDLLNDVEYDVNKNELGSKEPWKDDYRNYTYYFNKTDDSNRKETTTGQFGKHNYVKFNKYTPLNETSDYEEPNVVETPSATLTDSTDINTDDDYVTDSRVYSVITNWKTDKDTKSDFFNGQSLNTRNPFYVKVNFSDNVNMVTLTYGKADHSIEKKVTLRKGSKKNNVFKIPVIENTSNSNGLSPIMYIEQFTLSTSDGLLGNTSFSVLKSREVDVMVYEENLLSNKKKVLKTQKTIRIEQGKLKNHISFVDNEVFNENSKE